LLNRQRQQKKQKKIAKCHLTFYFAMTYYVSGQFTSLIGRGPSMERISATLPLVGELQQVIRDSGLTLTEIGKASGVDQGQLSRFVRGERTITLPAAAKLCVFFGLRLAKSGDETAITVASLPSRPKKKERS
jgi:hypothetical protein